MELLNKPLKYTYRRSAKNDSDDHEKDVVDVSDDGSDEGQQRGDENAPPEHSLPANLRRQPPSRNLGYEVAPEIRAQHETLYCFIPYMRSILK